MSDCKYKIRRAMAADLEHLLHHRRAMFYEMGYTDAAVLDGMEAACRPFLKTALNDGRYRSWVAESADGTVIAGGGVIILPWLPSPIDVRPLRAMVLNIYTEPEFRRQGVARSLMETIIAWCRSEGFQTVALHASDQGRPLYESMGFAPTNEMRLALR
ncbi:MAG: GNAT family N-acetyltransferase [Terriglobales bacterium]|jgi:GNAT superfamily N-acetyltransferase